MKKFFIFLMIVFSVTCSATITQVDMMEEVFAKMEAADSDTLALFDVDMVLIQPSNPAFQMANIKRYSSVSKRIIQQMSPEKRMVFLALMSVESDAILVDPRTPGLLRKLTKRGVRAMALTANLTGELKGIASMEGRRLDELRKLGIDFVCSAPYQQDIVFSQLPSFRGNYSVYSNGVLFANGTVCSKGEVLLSFFEKASYYPKKVIFVDDREENLQDVERALVRLGKPIEFLGIHYAGANHAAAEEISAEEFERRWNEIYIECQRH